MSLYRKGYLQTFGHGGVLTKVKTLKFASEDALKRWVTRNASKAYSRQEDFYMLKDGRELQLDAIVLGGRK